MKRILTFVVPALLITGFLIWWTTPTQVVKRKVANLIESFEVEAESGKVTNALKSEKLAKLLAEEITVSYPEPDFGHGDISSEEPVNIERSNLISLHRYLVTEAKLIKITEQEIQNVEIENDSATVSLTLNVSLEVKGHKRENQSLKGTLTFQRTDKKWLLTAAKFSE